MKKINTVLFDFDGTLMDTNDIIIRSWQYTFNQILGRDEDENKLLATFGEPLEMTMENFFGGGKEDIERNIDIYRSYQLNHYSEDIKMFPGVFQMLSSLKNAGYEMAMVTSRLSHTTYQGIDKFGIRHFFDAIVTADDTTKHKPDPQPINIALDKIGAKPESCLMVGDTWMDLKCAENAGVTSVLVGWSRAFPVNSGSGASGENSGNLAGSMQNKTQPDYIINEASDLAKLLAQLND